MDGFFAEYERQMEPYLVRAPALETSIAIDASNSITDRVVGLCNSMVAMIGELERHLGLRPPGD